MLRRVILAAALCLTVVAALAQAPPFGRAASEGTGTITTTGDWQLVFPAARSVTSRADCRIQNTGTHAMSVFFGPTAPANGSYVGFPLSPASASGSLNVGGGYISCGNVGGGLTNGPVWITGTSGDTFEYTSQP